MNSINAALTLLHTSGIGAKTTQRLLASFNQLTAVVEAPDAALRDAGLSIQQVNALRAVSEDDFRLDLDWANADGNHLIPIDDPRYPSKFRQISDPPLLLYVTGDLDVLCTPQLAMVGSRNPTAGGTENAERFAADLASRGLCITSGLANGIDAAAHRGALSVDGLSIAVTGTGLDRVYPAANRSLAHQLAEQGALVSELPIGTAPIPSNFPRRNRLISALSCGVLVVEATVRSGSLITARMAIEQGREVLAVPGSIHNPMARGCHALIRQGAKLVETAEDVLEEIGALLSPLPLTPCENVTMQKNSPADQPPEEHDPDYAQLMQCIGYDPVSIDTLVQRTGFQASEISSMLLMLELTGKIDKLSGGRYLLK